MTQKKSAALLEWKYEDIKDRSPIWYMVALSIAIGLVIWGFFTRQYGMSIVIMLLAGIIFFIENNADDNVDVSITELGVKVQNNFYDYAKISSFYLVYQGDQAVYLRLNIKKRGIKTLSIRIDNSIAPNIRATLVNFIEESDQQEISFLEKLSHILKL